MRHRFAFLFLALALGCPGLASSAAAQDPPPVEPDPAPQGAPQDPAAQEEERLRRAQATAQRLAEAAERETRGGFLQDNPLEQQLARQVDVVLLLDCSGSMRFALESAKTQFWRIASSMSAAEPRPKLRIGLMAYGLRDQEFPLVPLNEDLLVVFDELLRLDISRSGGDEWIGEAMLVAGSRFWSQQATQTAQEMLSGEKPAGAETLPPVRLYFVFGNETVYQGPSDPVEIARALPPVGRVNTVHCISPKHTTPGDAAGWTALAQAGQGVAMRLDTSGDPMLILSPYDRDLARLSRRLTESYIPLGVLGEWMVQRRRNVENVAAQWPRSVEADYVTAMAAWQKNEAVWDLAARVMAILRESDPRTHEAILRGNEYFVDLQTVEEALAFIDPAQLPREFARMKMPERAAAVAKAAMARQKLIQEIQRLALQRRLWILRKAMEDAARRHWRWQLVLDLEKALRDPLRAAGFRFADEE
jgi:hypothetical protein